LSKKKYWIFKSEPDVFSIDDLKRVSKEPWNGVRNYQARNFMRDEMNPGDAILFYHSSCPAPGVAGVACVASASYPDSTSLDKKSEYFDPKSSKDNPRWFLVDVSFEKKFKQIVALSEIKEHPELADLLILRKGNRLSITPINKKEFDFICSLGSAQK
jgi:predicted RNA-binding protein with PUA-like domain